MERVEEEHTLNGFMRKAELVIILHFCGNSMCRQVFSKYLRNASGQGFVCNLHTKEVCMVAYLDINRGSRFVPSPAAPQWNY